MLTNPRIITPLATLLLAAAAHAASVASPSGITLILDEATGNYAIQSQTPEWTFAGTLHAPLNEAKIDRVQSPTGNYQQLTGHVGTTGITVSFRLAADRPTVLFSWTTSFPTDTVPLVFPILNKLPENLHALSFGAGPFAPAAFSLQNNGTPYVLFDDHANTAILSPASDFLISQMAGTLDGHGSLTSGLNPGVTKLPANFTHATLLAIGPGIHQTCLTWGRALSNHLQAVRPGNDADPLLKYLGYWTDNKAFYYYHYDLDKGYTGTLDALMRHYRDTHLPFRYLQLDSWWYDKSLTTPDGKIGKTKNPKLPEGEWNRYGGTLRYRADSFLFPNGLAVWQKSLNLPLVVHGRWIDPESPYHQQYQIAGLAPTDPKYWNDTAAYLHDSGVICYEQDWLNQIYDHSPPLQNTVDAANAFADNMAKATQDRGMTMQYCMAPARFFLQAAKYPNLTTIRTSEDGFTRSRWQPFLYTSILAEAVGRWPWTDVFRSTDTPAVLLSTLSAGPVGTGDQIGKENADNIFKAVRADGVIVKPDAPLVPTDATLIADAAAKKQPLLATTFTDHHGIKTVYAFAFMRPGDSPALAFTPKSLGATTPVYLYEPAANTARLLNPDDTFSTTLDPHSYGYYELLPVTRSGIALAGDQGKFVSMGKQRIAELADAPEGLTALILLAPDEQTVTLHGFAAKTPAVLVERGAADPIQYDPATHHFTVTFHADTQSMLDQFSSDPVRRMKVEFSIQ